MHLVVLHLSNIRPRNLLCCTNVQQYNTQQTEALGFTP